MIDLLTWMRFKLFADNKEMEIDNILCYLEENTCKRSIPSGRNDDLILDFERQLYDEFRAYGNNRFRVWFERRYNEIESFEKTFRLSH